ncbi:MAG: hypothetical protein U1G08_17775 [Verrucomicrobiota bacterium]
MILNPKISGATSGKRSPAPRCPGDAPVLSISPASADRIRLVFSPDGRQVVACILPGEVSPRILAMCRALGGGNWEPCPELAKAWGVHTVFASEVWGVTMFVGALPRPQGVAFQFLD